MARAGILYAEVRKVADELSSSGISPTIERVRQRLGGGSFSTISRHLRAWREERLRRSQRAAGEAADGPPEAVGQAVQAVWGEIRKAAEESIAAARARAVAEIDEARAQAAERVREAERARSEAEARMQEQEAARIAAETALRELRGAAQRLEVELAREQEGRKEMGRQLAELTSRLEDLAKSSKERLREEQRAADERLRQQRQVFERALVAEREAHARALAEISEAAEERRLRLEARISSLEAAGREQAEQLAALTRASAEEGRAHAREILELGASNQALAAESRRLEEGAERLRKKNDELERRLRDAQKEVVSLGKRVSDLQERAAAKHTSEMERVLMTQQEIRNLLLVLSTPPGPTSS